MSTITVIYDDIPVDPAIKSQLEQIASQLPDGNDWSELLIVFQNILRAEKEKRKGGLK